MFEIHNLNSYYGKSHILRDIELEVGTGEIIALLGRNGAGKTTTIESIMGFVPRVEGSILYNGENIRGDLPEHIFHRGISWIPEDRRVFPNLTIEQNLKLGLRGTDDQENINDIMELFPRLKERRDQMARSMSGGEQQMLAIGRGLVSEPNLLLVDEPYEGLMPSLLPQISDALDKYRKQEMSMVIAEQNTDETLELADRAYIIQTGSIVYSGTAEDLSEKSDIQKKYIGVM